MNQELLIRKVWLALIRDCVPSPAYHSIAVYFRDTKDILELIGDAVQVSEDILRFSGERTRPWSKFWQLVDSLSSGHLPAPVHSADSIESLKEILQLLRFPKRFTPTKRLSNSMDKLWEVNDKCRAYQPDDHRYIVDLVKEIICERFKYYSFDYTERYLSQGADLEHNANHEEKLAYLESLYPDFIWPYASEDCQPRNLGLQYPVNKPQGVPKNYKTDRFIAVESQEFYTLATIIAKQLVKKLPSYVVGEDQEMQKINCVLASFNNEWDTIDLNSASDSVSCSLCRDVLPWPLYRAILGVTSIAPRNACDIWVQPGERRYRRVATRLFWNPDSGQYEPHKHAYGMISTMGSPVTFPLEEHIFSAAMEAACILCQIPIDEGCIGLVGDDMIVDHKVTATLIDILTVLGFDVNKEKSYFGEEFFRESCGMEALHGTDISSKYWPRKSVDTNDFSTLIAMQHKLYRYPYANDVLVKHIRKLFPKVTESFPESQYDDIWSDYPRIVKASSPYRPPRDVSDEACELHTTVEAVYNGSISQRTERWNYRQWLIDPDRYLSEDPVLRELGYREMCNHRAMSSKPATRVCNRKYLI